MARLSWLLAAPFAILATPALADPLSCNLSNYAAGAGLTAQMDGDVLVTTWNGDAGEEVRLRLGVQGGAPVIDDLSLRAAGGAWSSIASKVSPDFAVVSGLRRMSQQQLDPLIDLKVPLTQAEIDKHRWDPFWDTPLDISSKIPTSDNAPPKDGIPGTNQPGLPRDPSEVKRASAVYAVTACDVRTDGARLEISFPGVTLGVFKGKLMYTVYRGSNLIRQEIVASTDEPWVAYKYDAGLKGLPITEGSKVVWRDTGKNWQDYQFGAIVNDDKAPLRASNRVAFAEQAAGSIAAFPPPHKFLWARQLTDNRGYNWYRKDSETAFGFGIRQSENENEGPYEANWALYSARPGTEQLMPVYLYPSLKPAQQAVEGVLQFTRGDTYKPVPGFKVMSHHTHMDLGARLLKEGFQTKLPDLEAFKATGINIMSPIWSFSMAGFAGADPRTVEQDAEKAAQAALPRGGNYIELTWASVQGARLHSDKDFLIMPNHEIYDGPLGGHVDLLYSKPVLWDQRKPGQPFTENDPKYGKVYHIGSASEFMDMVRAENVLISMPHPRSKGSTGYPDVIKDGEAYNDPQYHGFGFRWGMGLDGSERRSCEYRCLPLLDDMSNWAADRPGPLKQAIAITETRYQEPGDDVYASAPVTYVKIDRTPDNPAPVIEALKKGDSFITAGGVLISHYEVQQNGRQSKVIADVEWTFPLDMVEIVWGDGKTTGSQVVSATGLPPFGRHRFEIPFDARGKKWIRFAAWDSASEGAFTQPQRLGAAR